MKARLTKELDAADKNQYPSGKIPAGTVILGPTAPRLVRLGVATPDDDECRKACGRSPQQIEAAQVAYGKVALGIHPEDYKAFDAGFMRGYNPDGSWIPGPNISGYEENDTAASDTVPEAAETADTQTEIPVTTTHPEEGMKEDE